MREQYPASRSLSPLTEPAPRAARASRERGSPSLVVCEARTDDDVRAAQRLRYQVFVQEMGARLAGASGGLEADRFDPFCTHILVRRGAHGPVVGTYRLLHGERAAQAGGFICEELFDLEQLAGIRGEAVELGRACVDPRLRGGVVLMLLWSGIARYVMAHGARYLFGCASLDRRDGGASAARVCARLAADHAAPPAFAVTPRVQVPPAADRGLGEGRVPVVLKGYLRAGAWVCGEPAWDRHFDTADLLVLLPVAKFVPRYARHFLDRVPP